MFQVQSSEQNVNLFESIGLNLSSYFVVFADQVKHKILVVLVANLAVVMVLVWPGLGDLLVVFVFNIYVVLPMFS
jgi:hypothetical protein